MINNFYDDIRKTSSHQDISEKYAVFFKDFKEGKFIHQNFLVFDLLRQILLAITITAGMEALTTIIIFSVLNCIFILFLIIVQPFKERREFLQNLVNEICLIMSCGASLRLAILDLEKNYDFEYRMQIGWIVVAANMTLIYCFIVRFIFETIESIRHISNNLSIVYKKWRVKQIFKMKAKGRRPRSSTYGIFE